MIVKLITILVIAAALVYMLLPRRPAVGRQSASRMLRVPRAQDLEKCARCGIWLPAGQGCDCDSRA